MRRDRKARFHKSFDSLISILKNCVKVSLNMIVYKNGNRADCSVDAESQKSTHNMKSPKDLFMTEGQSVR